MAYLYLNDEIKEDLNFHGYNPWKNNSPEMVNEVLKKYFNNFTWYWEMYQDVYEEVDYNTGETSLAEEEYPQIIIDDLDTESSISIEWD